MCVLRVKEARVVLWILVKKMNSVSQVQIPGESEFHFALKSLVNVCIQLFSHSPIVAKIVGLNRFFSLSRFTGLREGRFWIQNSQYAVLRICDTLVHHSSVINLFKKCRLFNINFPHNKRITCKLHLLSLSVSVSLFFSVVYSIKSLLRLFAVLFIWPSFSSPIDIFQFNFPCSVIWNTLKYWYYQVKYIVPIKMLFLLKSKHKTKTKTKKLSL